MKYPSNFHAGGPHGGSAEGAGSGARIKREAPLNMPELLSILKQLLIGGNETSTNLIGSMMLLLLNNPDQLEAVIADRSLEANTVEEALRLDSPVQGLFRSAMREVEIGGVRIPEGGHLELLYASGNRDDARFHDSDHFDLKRPDSSNHMAFGFGIHFCIGAPLARYVRNVGVEGSNPFCSTLFSPPFSQYFRESREIGACARDLRSWTDPESVSGSGNRRNRAKSIRARNWQVHR